MHKIFCSFLVAFTLVIPSSAQKTDKALTRKLNNLDVIFSKALLDFNVPGMSIAIVLNDQVVMAKGYGVKNSTKTDPVDENTLFAIASNTKAFTAAALAILVDEGKISWNDKVVEYLPYFKLYSPYVTEEMTIKDLLCHRSGLATFSGDLVWYGTGYNREEIIRRAALLEPVYGFREQWGYSNIMFLAAGEVVAKVSGQPWDTFIREKFFTPAGMPNSNTSIRDFVAGGNIASPHNEVVDKNVPISYVNWDNIGPAGSINSSALDMAQWLRLQLGTGTINRNIVWNADRSWEMWENQVPRPVSAWQRANMPSRHFNGYGLGWELMEYGGYKIVSHGGGYDGMISKSVLIPELNLGFVILTNNINSLPSCLTYEILDEFTKSGSTTDWTAMFLQFKTEDEVETQNQKEADLKARIADTKPSLSLENYCGTYHSELYGDVTVNLDPETNEMLIHFDPTPLFKGNLTHWHYDTFVLNWSTQMMLPPGKVTFKLNAAGLPEEMVIDVPNPDFDFGELKLFRVDSEKK